MGGEMLIKILIGVLIYFLFAIAVGKSLREKDRRNIPPPNTKGGDHD